MAPSLKIAHLFPDLLNLYGDGGNVKCLVKRCEWRGIDAEVIEVRHGDSIDLSQVNLVFLGGGPDREQRLASKELFALKDQLKQYVEAGGVLLAICGGYQILGNTWLLGDEIVEGLSILDIETKRPPKKDDRLIGDVILRSEVYEMPVVGYENHAGRTYLGSGVRPFGSVLSSAGRGNNEADKQDGALYKNVIGTYLHGPLLAKNPQVADHLLAKALGAETLSSLDDTQEQAANTHIQTRYHL